MQAPVSEYRIEESLGFLMARLTFRMKTELHRTFRTAGYDVTPEQWAVLSRLWEEDELSQKEIAERTFKDRPNVTRILDGMEKKGLVRRRPDERDRRLLRVALTERGRELRADLIPLVLGVLERTTAGVAPQAVEEFKALLKRMYLNLCDEHDGE